MTSATNVAIRATPPSAAGLTRRSWTAMNGWSTARTIVKMTTATTKDVASSSISSSTAAATISPTALPASVHRRANEEADHDASVAGCVNPSRRPGKASPARWAVIRPGVERQHRQLGRRAADEAVDQQEVFRLLGGQRVLGALAADRQCASRPRSRPRSSGQRTAQTSPPQTKNAFCGPAQRRAIRQSSSLRSRSSRRRRSTTCSSASMRSRSRAASS